MLRQKKTTPSTIEKLAEDFYFHKCNSDAFKKAAETLSYDYLIALQLRFNVLAFLKMHSKDEIQEKDFHQIPGLDVLEIVDHANSNFKYHLAREIKVLYDMNEKEIAERLLAAVAAKLSPSEAIKLLFEENLPADLKFPKLNFTHPVQITPDNLIENVTHLLMDLRVQRKAEAFALAKQVTQSPAFKKADDYKLKSLYALASTQLHRLGEANLSQQFYLRLFELSDTPQKIDMEYKAIVENRTDLIQLLLKTFPESVLTEDIDKLQQFVLKKAMKTEQKLIHANPDDFLKTRTHFTEKEQTIALEHKHHSAATFKKKPKLPSSAFFAKRERDENDWYKLSSTTIQDRDNLYPIIVLAGELYRLEIGNTQPKYRRDRENTLLVSKGVKNAETYSESRIRSLKENSYKGQVDPCNEAYLKHLQDCYSREGMGRCLIASVVNADDDVHGGNCLIRPDGYFVRIDHDRVAYPITYKFHRSAHDARYLFYKPGTDPVYEDEAEKKEAYPLDKETQFMGEIHAEDYNDFPFLKHYFPRNWVFMHMPFSVVISSNRLFINEKLFATLQAILLLPIKLEMCDIHLSNPVINLAFKKMLTERTNQLKNICLSFDTGNALFNYLYGRPAFATGEIELDLLAYKKPLRAILFELMEFFQYNRHYHSDWKMLSDAMIDRFFVITDQVLYHLRHDLSEIKSEFQEFAAKIFRNDREAYALVADFYTSQEMTYRARLVKEKINATTMKAESLAAQSAGTTPAVKRNG